MTGFDFRHHAEQVDPAAHIAPSAVVVGDVTLMSEGRRIGRG